MRRETGSLRPPIFLEGSLSGGDNRRDRLFQAQSGLSWPGEKRDQPNESSGDLAVTSQIQDQGAKWANLSAEELVFHVSIGYSVLRPYAERSFFRANEERQAPILRATEKYSAAGGEGDYNRQC
jgi:hypothetical protein